MTRVRQIGLVAVTALVALSLVLDGLL